MNALFLQINETPIVDEIAIKNENIQPAGIQLQCKEISEYVDRRTVISNLENKFVSYDLNGDILIENVKNSKVAITGNLVSLRINNVSESTIELDCICNGSIYIETVRNGKLTVAGDQIRIHECENVDIFLFTRNSCILEDCENLRFSPNKKAAKIAGIQDESYWKSVQDFGFNPEGSFSLVEID